MKVNSSYDLCMADFLDDHANSDFTDKQLEIIHRNAAKKRQAIKRLYGNTGFKLKSIDVADLYRLRKYYTDCMNESGWQLVPQLSGSEAEGFWSVAYKNESNVIIVCSMTANSVENDKVPVIILSDIFSNPESESVPTELAQAS